MKHNAHVVAWLWWKFYQERHYLVAVRKYGISILAEYASNPQPQEKV